jgi:hypothetical protein
MSSDEFTDWMLYYQLNPFGPWRGDVQAALVARTIANANAPKGKKFHIKDFMPAFKAHQPRKDTIAPEQVLSFFHGIQQGRG